MTELLTAAQMRAIEAAAIASGAVTGLQLMERAGAGVVQAVFDEWPELRAGSFRAVVLCGPGNNGGDGFVVARLLKEWGWEVEVFLYGDAAKLPPDARVNYERWVGMGEVRLVNEPDSWEDALEVLAQHKNEIVFDALFGTGLTRPLAEPVLSLLRHLDDQLDECIIRYVAVDIPSGLCADSGRGLSRHLRKSDLAVTFHRAKLGHYLDLGPHYSGKVAVIDIGLAGTSAQRGERVRKVGGPHPMLAKRSSGHKFSHGHALILSGPLGQGGAARMTARGALRIGAGLVTMACPPEALAENAGRLDAIMLKTVADGAGLAGVLADPRINALCLGPGFGTSPREAALLAAALAPPPPAPPHEGEGRHQVPPGGHNPTAAAKALPLPPRGEGSGVGGQRRPVVLDADALTLISRDPALFALLHETCVLTPHGGEFARLFPDISAKLDAPATTGPAYSKVDATREAAARAGCVVLFKGPDTVIASPDGTCAVNSAAYDRAAPWLATAGSGDVLAGFITGLMARGFAPQQAAETGAWLHVECARSFGPGLIAEDLAEELPKVFRALGL